MATVVPAPVERHEPGVGHLHVWTVPATAELLEALLRDLFERHWRGLTFGPIVQGAAWELHADGPPGASG